MTTADIRSYTILDIDLEGAAASAPQQPVKHVMLARLAVRFNVSAASVGDGTGWAPSWLSIWLASSKSGKFKNSTIEWFAENVEAGDSVEIPYAGDDWEWRNVPVNVGTLGELCAQDKKKPDPLRIGGPLLAPELLYFHIVNEAYRGLYTRRLSPGSRTSPDLDPASLRFEKGDALFLPYPIRRKGVIVKAAASDGTKPSATAALAPTWVIQFYDLLKAIESKAGELAVVNKLCSACQQEGAQAWSHIMVLHELVRFQMRTTDQPGATLGRLEHLFEELNNQAMTALFVNVATVAVPEASKKRKVLTEELVALMSMDRPAQRGGELSRQDLESKLRGAPRERINRAELMIDMKDRVLAGAYVALAASPRAEIAHAMADQVMKEIGLIASANGVSSEAGSQAVGAATTVVSTSVGNLPGPSTLAVVFVWLRASRKVTEVARATGDATKSVSVPANLIGEMGSVVGHDLAREIAAASASTDAAAAKAGAALGAQLEQKASTVSDAVAASFMVSKGWNLGMTVVNLIALYNIIQSNDPIDYRKKINIVGGSYLAALGTLRVLASLGDGGAFKKAFDVLGEPFGIVGVVVSMASGVITAVAGDTMSERFGGGLQAASGVLSLGGFMLGSGPAGFVLLGLGGFCMLGSVVISNLDNISGEIDAAKRHLGIGAKVVLREQLNRFLKFSIVQRAGASLVSEVKEILNQLESERDSGLHDFERTEGNLTVLRALRLAEVDIDLMTYSSYPMLPPTFGLE
jgi:hypothetical protein